MTIIFNNQPYVARVWQVKNGRIADAFAYDSETVPSDDPSVVQDYVLGSAFDGTTVFFIRRQDLAAFWSIHTGRTVYMHTASFDWEVTSKACGIDFHDMIEAGRILDISIYFRLYCGATDGNVPARFSLDLMTKELLGVELVKDDRIRMGFGAFYHDGVVDYAAIPVSYLEYAARDAIATFQIATLLEPRCRRLHEIHAAPAQDGTTNAPHGFLSHDIQLRGDVALRKIEHHGVTVDPAAVEALDNKLSQEAELCQATLAKHGFIPGQKGNQSVFDRIIRDAEQVAGVCIPLTEKSGRKSTAEKALAPLADHEAIAAFLELQGLEKLRNTYVSHLKTPDNRVHPRYRLIVNTGRTSCRGPAIQTLPRTGGVRECVVASQGHVLLACDYRGIELCSLAQTTFRMFGHSTMRDLLNRGVDLHAYVAGMILHKDPADVTKAERQKAKAINFGLPGGMRAHTLKAYARANYGVDLTVEEAEVWRTAWLDLFPEMRPYLEESDNLGRLGGTLDLDSFPTPSASLTNEIGAMIVIRIAGGAIATTNGRLFSPAELAWAWAQIAQSRAGTIKKFAKDIAARRGSRLLQQAITPGYVATIPTGRVRANCSFTALKNFSFQALASDGAKLALYDLIRAGYRVVAFIHDEALIEIVEMEDHLPVAEDISRIMVDAMRKVCPDVAITTEYAVMRRWSKKAAAKFDNQGRLIPYDEVTVS